MTDMAGDIEKALRIISDDMAENGTGFRTDPHQIEADAIRQGAELITCLRAQVEAAEIMAAALENMVEQAEHDSAPTALISCGLAKMPADTRHGSAGQAIRPHRYQHPQTVWRHPHLGLPETAAAHVN